ncbi:hypothetical protein Tco_0868641 [Tanacetum coccineum]
MNSYTFMGLDDEEEGEEISSRKKSFIKRAITYIKMRRQATRVTRNIITRDRAGAHTRLVAAFFSETPMYNETRFRKTFRMARPLFNQIVNANWDTRTEDVASIARSSQQESQCFYFATSLGIHSSFYCNSRDGQVVV